MASVKIGQQGSTAELGKSVPSLGKCIQSTCCMRQWTTYIWHISGTHMPKNQISECHFTNLGTGSVSLVFHRNLDLTHWGLFFLESVHFLPATFSD